MSRSNHPDNDLFAMHMIQLFLSARNRNNDDDSSDDSFVITDENRCSPEEKEMIEESFFENREKKTSKKIEKPKPRELTEAEILRASEDEDRLTNNYRAYISNKKLLSEVLSELNGVNPNDPLFKEFY